MTATNYTIKEGDVFHRLTAVKIVGKTKGRANIWLCVCECGNEINVASIKLRNGNTKSCGCLQRQAAALTGHNNATHGATRIGANRAEYHAWASMKTRCFNPNSLDYGRYGGRGITVCDEWKDSFETFYADMGKRPEGCSLDRIDNNSNYEPSNCRWATKQEQSINRRSTILITWKEQTMCLLDWAKYFGLNYTSLTQKRKKKNMSDDELLTYMINLSEKKYGKSIQ